jgi:hypothetical protein
MLRNENQFSECSRRVLQPVGFRYAGLLSSMVISLAAPMKAITRRNFLAGSVLLFAVRQQAPTSAGAAEPALIEDLVVAYRILAQQGVLDGFGHVSARHNRAAIDLSWRDLWRRNWRRPAI